MSIVITNCFTILSDTSKNAFTGSTRRHHPLKQYTNYRISTTNYIAAFVKEITKICVDYGLGFTDYKKETVLETKNVLTYKVTSKDQGRKFVDEEGRLIIPWKIRFSFNLETPETIVYEDFRNKYSNLLLLSCATEFSTKDKYESPWCYSVLWDKLSDDFDHDYGSTSSGNFGYDIPFNCTMDIFEVSDEMYYVVKEFDITMTDIIN